VEHKRARDRQDSSMNQQQQQQQEVRHVTMHWPWHTGLLLVICVTRFHLLDCALLHQRPGSRALSYPCMTHMWLHRSESTCCLLTRDEPGWTVCVGVDVWLQPMPCHHVSLPCTAALYCTPHVLPAGQQYVLVR
jgi:hypothetical protein